MCGRYYLEISKENMSFVSNIDSFEYKTNYNISPQTIVPAIINNELINTKWGYFPSWLKEQDMGIARIRNYVKYINISNEESLESQIEWCDIILYNSSRIRFE